MKQNRIIGVIGPKGSGKTTAVVDALKETESFAVFDLNSEAAYLQCCEEIIVGNPRELAEALREPYPKICYRPLYLNLETDQCPSLDWFLTLCYQRGHILCVIEEAHFLCSPWASPHSLSVAARLGRHRELSIIYISQSFSAVHKCLNANANEFWLFPTREPREIEAIAKRCGEDTADEVYNAPRLAVTGKPSIIVWTESQQSDKTALPLFEGQEEELPSLIENGGDQ